MLYYNSYDVTKVGAGIMQKRFRVFVFLVHKIDNQVESDFNKKWSLKMYIIVIVYISRISVALEKLIIGFF